MATEQTRAMEAILMVAEGPVEPSLLAQLLEMDVEAVEAQLRELMASYEVEDRGFILTKVAGGYRYQSHPDLAPYVERFVLEGQSARLSAAALETLAIIAYKQPISRGQVAAIRGVSVDGVIRTLEQRGYITEVGRDPGPGNPSLFGTTVVFLEKLGLNSIDELPPIADFVPGPDVVEQLEQGLRAEIDTDPELAPADEAAEAEGAEETADEAPAADATADADGPTADDTVVDLTDGVTVEPDPTELLAAAADGAVVAMDTGEAPADIEAGSDGGADDGESVEVAGEDAEVRLDVTGDDIEEPVVGSPASAEAPEVVGAGAATEGPEVVGEDAEGSGEDAGTPGEAPPAAVPVEADEPVELTEPEPDPEEPVEVTQPVVDPDEPVETTDPEAPVATTEPAAGPTTVAGLIAAGGTTPAGAGEPPAPEREVAARPFRDERSVLGAPAFGPRPVEPDQDEAGRPGGGSPFAGHGVVGTPDHADADADDLDVDADPGRRADVIDLAARRAAASGRDGEEASGASAPHDTGDAPAATHAGDDASTGEAGGVTPDDDVDVVDEQPGDPDQADGRSAAPPVVGEAAEPVELNRDERRDDR